MARNLGDAEKEQIYDAVRRGLTNTEISKETGYKREAVIRWANPYRAGVAAPIMATIEIGAQGMRICAAPDEEESPETPSGKTSGWQFKEKGDDATLGLDVDEPITTLEDLIRVAKIDTAMWRVDSWECTAWNAITKDKAKVAHLHQLWRVAAKLKRVAPKVYLDALESLFKNAEAHAPFFPIMDASKCRMGSPVALVICLFDAHFGKLAWAAECGEDYDLKIAEAVYRNAVNDILVRTAHLNVERIFFPIGNDGLHIDSSKNTTTGGTVVDTDGRFAKIIEIAERAKIEAVELAMYRAPVDVFHVPGNHDYMASYHLIRTIAAWFRNTDRVTVDYSPMSRKYRQYGNMLLGFIHGDNVNDGQVKSLMSLMMAEQREKLSETKASEWFCGHQHRSRKFEQKSTDTYQGVVVRFVNALSSTDAWHFDKMMVGTQHAAEVYVYDKEQGFRGHEVVPVRR